MKKSPEFTMELNDEDIVSFNGKTPTQIREELKRTVREFVEDMVSDGRNLKQILIVAAQTKYKNTKEEIEKEYRRLVK